MINFMRSISLILALTALSFCLPATASEKHNHSATHSDALLFLLTHKIALKKLQTQFEDASSDEKVDNLNNQKQHLEKALPVLNGYMARPETRYPNMQMYHESLKSRGAILADFSDLIGHYFRLHTSLLPSSPAVTGH